MCLMVVTNPRYVENSFSLYTITDHEDEHGMDCLYTVDSRYLEIEGTLRNTSGYPYFDISDLRD